MKNDEVLLNLLRKYAKIRNLFVETYQQLSELRDLGKENKLSLVDQSNMCYILRESAKYLKDLRKEFDGVEELLQSTCCAQYIIKNTANPNNAEPIRTGIVTATPKVNMCAKVPKMRKDPEAYMALMEHFGISKEFAGRDILRAHWPKLKEYLTELASSGEPLPAGLKPDETYPIYSLILRMNTDLDEIASELEQLCEANRDETAERRRELCVEYLKKYSKPIR